MNVVLSLVRGD